MQKSVCLYLFLFISFTVSSLLYAEPRHALLIANGEYKHFAGLGNPVPDANMLKDSLIQLGFEVRIIENASKEIMDSEIKMFEKKLSVEKGIGFFHYGGHAVQVKGENYLIPADADIPNEERVSTRAINLSDVMYSMKATTNIIVLDACRDNPLPSSDNRSATRGLQMVKVKPHNSVIVYSARDGETARDGVFTPILSEKILQNKNFLDVMRDVRNEVLKKTDNEQKPGLYDELLTEINLAAVSMEQLKKMTEKEEAASEELDKEIAKLRSQNKTSETEIELQKIEAEAKRKKLELQQRRDAETRKEAEEKRIAEEKAKQNENQRLQEEKFAKMKSENDKKARELEKLRNDSLDIEGWVKSANQIKSTIDNIVNSYEIAMNKAIEETKTFYQDKRNAIYITEWETTQEFENRKQSEMLSIDSTEKADIDKITNNYQTETENNIAELKEELDNMINKKTYSVSGKRVNVIYKDYERDNQCFPIVVTDSLYPNESYDLFIDVTSNDVETRRQKCQEVVNNIQSSGYIGYMDYDIIWNETDNSYIPKRIAVGLATVDGIAVVKQELSNGNKKQYQSNQVKEVSNEPIKETVTNNNQNNKDQVKMQTYKKHTYVYGSLIGIGSGIGAVSLTLIPVGAANMADCYERRLDYGVGVSAAILGVGFGTAVVSAIMLSVTSVIWYRDISANGIRQQIKRYNSSRMTAKQRAFAVLSVLSPNVLCGNGMAEVGMGIRL